MKKWIKIGLGWGIWMFIAMTFIWPLIKGEELSFLTVVIKFFFWIIAGLIFGYASFKYKIVKGKFKK